MSDLANRISDLSKSELEQLLQKLASAQHPSTDAPRIGQHVRSAMGAPLSYSQERLWFLEQLGLVKAAYHVPGMVRLSGDLDVVALERSLVEIVARHESLRTRFDGVEGQGVQRVVAVAEAFGLQREDFSELGATEQAVAIKRLTDAVLEEAFDLRTGPLLRVRLIRLAGQEHLLLLTMHHIVCDGWSVGVLVRELSELYTAYTQGRESPLAPLPIQYADYALWQRDWLQGEVLETQLTYWKQRLAGAPAALSLPTDRTRPAVASYRGANVTLGLSAQTTERLNALARREGATLFMVLLGAFQLVLGRWAGQDDVVVGAPITGRRQQELDQLIGFFVNTLVFRTDLSGNPSFRELLARVKETALGAYAHQDLPFEKLVEVLQPERDLSRQPIFQAWLVLEGLGQGAANFHLPGIAMRQEMLKYDFVQFDVNLSLRETGEGLVGTLDYATDLFERATMERLARALERVLDQIGAQPQLPVSQFTLLSASEREQQLVAWNATQTALPETSIVEQLVAQAARTPKAIAVRCGDAALSYADLDRRSNQLAHYLRGLGVGAEVRVGVCLERSLELPIALLGILKAGGAYVPLDANYPADRLGYLIGDSGMAVLVTQAAQADNLPAQWVRLVEMDEEAPLIAAQPSEPLANAVHPEQLAYLIYTSGSTGQPKGVMVSHGALGNHMQWMAQAHPLTAADVVLQKTALSFDASVWEVWAPLMAGAQLLLAEPGSEKDASRLARVCVQGGVTRLQLVPSMLRQLILMPELAACTALTDVFSGGEPLTSALRDALSARSRAALHNLYGPTETCIQTVVHTVTPDDGDPMPIGRPIANTQVYVLDEQLEPVPVGVVGELYIGGVALARGYAGQAALTADRFVADPYNVAGSRMYRSGDRARYLNDGKLVFEGRADEQVKLHGYRIELGEIEAALRRQPGVTQAAVAVRPVAAGQALVAYVVGEVPEPQTLRTALGKLLPEHMLPGQYVRLEALPYTTSGKLDRKALPAPESVGTRAPSQAPRTDIERQVASIWSELLELDDIGMEENFFELGGHSVLAMQISARIRDTFGVEVPLRELFERPTIQELSRWVERAERGGDVPIVGQAEELEDGVI